MFWNKWVPHCFRHSSHSDVTMSYSIRMCENLQKNTKCDNLGGGKRVNCPSLGGILCSLF